MINISETTWSYLSAVGKDTDENINLLKNIKGNFIKDLSNLIQNSYKETPESLRIALLQEMISIDIKHLFPI